MVIHATDIDPFAALKRFASSVQQRERCELCGFSLDAAHPHLLERNSRAIVCACGACALLFSNQNEGKFLRIPTSVRTATVLALEALHWDELGLPINLAFFFRDAEGKLRAMYPSPAGAVESSVHLDANSGCLADNTALASMQPETEALLVCRLSDEEAALILPIDECFRLTGLMRAQWHGLSGGAEVWKAIRGFLAEMRTRAEARTHHA